MDDIASESPEEAFEHEWQRQLFSLAVDDLRMHCEACGKQLQFHILQDYDLAQDERRSYAELAVRHGISELSVTNHLAWARRMLRGSVYRPPSWHHISYCFRTHFAILTATPGLVVRANPSTKSRTELQSDGQT